MKTRRQMTKQDAQRARMKRKRRAYAGLESKAGRRLLITRAYQNRSRAYVVQKLRIFWATREEYRAPD